VIFAVAWAVLEDRSVNGWLGTSENSHSTH
jgi:hypothetical protein